MTSKQEHHNPFIIRQPVSGDYFFGRDDLLQKMFQYIQAGESVSLVGERRTGKTSMLRRVQGLKEQYLSQPNCYVFPFIDFSGLDCEAEADIWVAILTSLSGGISEAKINIASAVEQLQSSEPVLQPLLMRVFRDLANNGIRVTFLFDEFEATVYGKNRVDLSFYRLLRNLALDKETKLTYVIATRQALSELEKELEPQFTSLSSPLFNVFHQLIIPLFSEEEAQQMVGGFLQSTDLALEDKITFWSQKDFLSQLSGFHPFFLQIACHQLFEHCILPDGTFSDQVPRDEIISSFLSEANSHFDYYWEISSPEEQRLMEQLAMYPVNIDTRSHRSVLNGLRSRCLVVRDVGTKLKWRLFSSALARWVEDKVPPKSWPPEEYEIVKKIETTGNYEVYQAKDLFSSGDLVAIKRLRPEKQKDEMSGKHFRREVAILRHFLRHIEHGAVLLRFLDRGETETGDRYFVTEFADKGTLRDYLKDNRPIPIEALKIAKAVCRGVDTIHELGVVHRDIKPGNIFLFLDDRGDVRAKLADFSLASVPEEWEIEDISGEDSFDGTFSYAAPEQLKGQGDRQSDLYSWGLVLFEVLTGEPLFSRENLLSRDELTSSFFIEKCIPQELAKILQKALQPEPKYRYQSAKEILEALEAIKVPNIADIKRHLQVGEKYGGASEWSKAKDEFKQGLKLCRWYGELNKLPGQLEELVRSLKAGHLCARGMVCLSERCWSEASEAFETLWEFGRTYFDVDIAEKLREAQLGHLDDERKLSLYTRGIKREAENPEEAYALFSRLYEEDPKYEDVAEKCAAIAFQISEQQDSWEQKVEWLEKVIEVEPDHRAGRTKQLLDNTRHRWAEELFEKNRYNAIAQLEKISPRYDHWSEVHQALVDAYYRLLLEKKYTRTEKSNLEAEAEASYRLGIERWCEGDLQSATEHFARIYPEAEVYKNARSVLVQIYVMLGRQEHKKVHWQDAAEWWDKALAMSPDEVYQALVNDYCRLLRSDDYVRTGWSKLDAEAEARYRLGVERWGKGDLEDAVEQFEEILRISKEVEVSELEGALFALAQIAQEYKELGHRNKSWSDASESLNRAKDIRATLREYGEEPKMGLLQRIVRGNRKRDN